MNRRLILSAFLVLCLSTGLLAQGKLRVYAAAFYNLENLWDTEDNPDNPGAGTNKICPDFDSALSRARNTAAVQNMQRFDGNQPCHELGRCVDCRSKSRGCNALLVLWGQMMDMAKVEVVLIDEPLGL